MTRRSLLKSNLLGYATAGFEASLHNLLTRARLRRVSTHCTWENTKVATSKPGSKTVPRFGWMASSLRLPLRSCMVVVWGRKCQGRCLLVVVLVFSLFVRSHRSEKVVFCFGNRALGTDRHNSSRVERDMSHALTSARPVPLRARPVVPKRASTRRFAVRAGAHADLVRHPRRPASLFIPTMAIDRPAATD